MAIAVVAFLVVVPMMHAVHPIDVSIVLGAALVYFPAFFCIWHWAKKV